MMQHDWGGSVVECTLPAAVRRRWAEDAATVMIPPLDVEARRHARSICDELDVRLVEDDPYTIALSAGAALARAHLPGAIVDALRAVRDGALPCLVLHGLPIGALAWDRVRAPADGRRPAWKTDWTSEMTLLGVVQTAGLESLGYFDTAGGALVHDLACDPACDPACDGASDGASARASACRPPLHTDGATLPRAHRAEGVAVLGLIDDGGARARVAPLDAILARLMPDQIAVLAREMYVLGTTPGAPPRAVLGRGPRGAEICLPAHTLEVRAPLDDVSLALDALRALDAALAPPVVGEVAAGPGDLLLVSNVACVHAVDSPPGRRWHQRVYYRESLSGLRDDWATVDTRLSRRFHAATA